VEWNWQGKTEVLGEKPLPVPLCPPQIPHGLTWDWSRASAVSGRWLTAWAMARPMPALVNSTLILVIQMLVKKKRFTSYWHRVVPDWTHVIFCYSLDVCAFCYVESCIRHCKSCWKKTSCTYNCDNFKPNTCFIITHDVPWHN
jgi:hypothetical protein